MESYEQMLNDAFSKIKQPQGTGERFEIPTAEGRFEGKKTIITNFAQLVDILRRPKEHFAKFLSKETATQTQIDGDRLILNNKVPSSKINQKIEQYTKEFVLCNECGKPDTELTKEDRITIKHCLACGAKHPVRSKI
ncbi:MAG: translation initiation factor IF-2 subunit beta [Nanoarchaeota archaeon]|nr:translation initiation factor IF-2 subunit beta [Nanoarchaeota archaeon]